VRGRLLARAIAWKLGRLRFPHQRDDAARARTRAIVDAFLLGADLALRRASDELLAGAGTSLPLQRRPFFWEGAAFGAAAWRCTARRPAPEPSGPPTYRLMRYTGYGVWNGLARAYHLREIPSTVAHWEAVGDYERLRPMMAGGAAFARVALAGRFDPRACEMDAIAHGDSASSAVHHGYGRALWFLHMDDADALTRAVEALPRFKPWLLEGVGIAIAFTNSESPEVVMARIRAFASADQPALLRGAGLSLAALVHDDAANEPRVSAMPAPELQKAYALCTWAGLQAQSGAGWYEEMMDLARRGLPTPVNDA
jgi:Protein of unknown function (DUF1702)